MIKLNDYLYSGDTVLRILKKYEADLRAHAVETKNQVDMAHCNYLLQLSELLEHNDFLSDQSGRINEFYRYMTETYPYLAFTFKGRIKSLFRAEEKFNGKVVNYMYDYYKKHGVYPPALRLRRQLHHFHDLIAYRIIISLPKCQVETTEDRHQQELEILYEIANTLPEFMEARGFTAELSGTNDWKESDLLDESVRPYYKDYIANANAVGYQSLHITFYDNIARCYLELQLRTKEMDDVAEIGEANHIDYEKMQAAQRARREIMTEGESMIFDEAYERCMALQNLDLSKLDVNMFTAYDEFRINDGCGLIRGRLIRPFEHLSRFQNG